MDVDSPISTDTPTDGVHTRSKTQNGRVRDFKDASIQGSPDTIGNGGFAKVTVVTMKNPDGSLVDVARKQTSMLEPRELFDHEVSILSKLKHKNIVRLLGVDTTMRYMFLELCDQGDLLKIAGKTSWRRTRSIAFELASGISYLHRNLVAHLDIKVENVLLKLSPTTGCKHVKICDFNSSKKTTPEGVAEIDIFTPEGTAPEYSSLRIVTGKCFPHDVWGFGITIFKLFTGVYPWSLASSGNQDYRKWKHLGHNSVLYKDMNRKCPAFACKSIN